MLLLSNCDTVLEKKISVFLKMVRYEIQMIPKFHALKTSGPEEWKKIAQILEKVAKIVASQKLPMYLM